MFLIFILFFLRKNTLEPYFFECKFQFQLPLSLPVAEILCKIYSPLFRKGNSQLIMPVASTRYLLVTSYFNICNPCIKFTVGQSTWLIGAGYILVPNQTKCVQRCWRLNKRNKLFHILFKKCGSRITSRI